MDMKRGVKDRQEVAIEGWTEGGEEREESTLAWRREAVSVGINVDEETSRLVHFTSQRKITGSSSLDSMRLKRPNGAAASDSPDTTVERVQPH